MKWLGTQVQALRLAVSELGAVSFRTGASSFSFVHTRQLAFGIMGALRQDSAG